MKVIVEYLGTGVIKVVDTLVRVVVNPLPPRPKVSIRINLQSSVEMESYGRNHAGPDDHSWKGNARHARKNWMRHPNRIENTCSARVLNPLY